MSKTSKSSSAGDFCTASPCCNTRTRIKRIGRPGDDSSGTDLRHFVDERLENGSTDLYAEALEFMERYVVTRVLRVCDGNQSKAARMLGITRGCLRSKVRALKVSIDTLVQVEGEPCEV